MIKPAENTLPPLNIRKTKIRQERVELFNQFKGSACRECKGGCCTSEVIVGMGVEPIEAIWPALGLQNKKMRETLVWHIEMKTSGRGMPDLQGARMQPTRTDWT